MDWKNKVAVMYRMLPKLYKKESKKLLKTAFQIGYLEGGLFTPLLRRMHRKRRVYRKIPEHYQKEIIMRKIP